MDYHNTVTVEANTIAEDGDAKVFSPLIRTSLELIIGKLQKLIDSDAESGSKQFRAFVFKQGLAHNGKIEDLSQFDYYRVNSIVLVFLVGNSYEGLKGINRGNTCIFKWNPEHLGSLPSVLNPNGGSKLTETESESLHLFSSYVVHEMLHALGAFHASHGLMSGVLPLEQINDPEYNLAIDVDVTTLKIARELMVFPSHKGLGPRMQYDMRTSLVSVNAEIPILCYMFLTDTKYTTHFNNYPLSNNKKAIKIRAPNNWDDLVLVYRGELHFLRNPTLPKRGTEAIPLIRSKRFY